MSIAAALIVVGWFYFFTVATSGDLHERGVNFDYYNLLIDGWRSGHLDLPLKPDSRLMALADPYDPKQNRDYRLADASYYRGRYFIYFGVGPAITLMLPYTLITGKHLPQAAAVLVYCWVGIAAASALWLSVRRRHFPHSRPWVAPLGVLIIGFGTHLLALARRPEIWELPISAGFAFLMLALWLSYRTLHAKSPVVTLGLAALCLGLAVASRPPALLAGGILVLPIWYLYRHRGDRRWWHAAVAATAVLGAVGVGLAWYNYARFESPFEFGQKYQLTSLKEGAVPHLNPRFFGFNVRAYFAWPVEWTREWPFIAARLVPPAPRGYFSAEDTYFLAVLSPFMWFAGLGLLRWRAAVPRDAIGFRVVFASLAAAHVPLALLLLCFFYAAERYMADFVPTLMLVALCGALMAEAAASTARWRRAVQLAMFVTGGATIVAGLLASFDYHHRVMKQTAPAAWNAIATRTEPIVQKTLSVFERTGPAQR
jgi:hypothetical protein